MQSSVYELKKYFTTSVTFIMQKINFRFHSRGFSRFQSYCLYIWKSTVKYGGFNGQTASNISVLLWMEKTDTRSE